jgi:hypothetical protein
LVAWGTGQNLVDKDPTLSTTTDGFVLSLKFPDLVHEAVHYYLGNTDHLDALQYEIMQSFRSQALAEWGTNDSFDLGGPGNLLRWEAMQEAVASFVSAQVMVRGNLRRMQELAEIAHVQKDMAALSELRFQAERVSSENDDTLQKRGTVLSPTRMWRTPELLPSHKQGLADALLLDGHYYDTVTEIPEYRRIMELTAGATRLQVSE